jgi:catechol 2,3-dioxygenase-like lactoylglutathione lyase family enzyme
MASVPPITRMLETALYVDHLDGARRFYETVMGLTAMSVSDRLVSMDAGEGTVLLLFQRGATAEGASTPLGRIPPHDGRGPAHFAFAITADDLERWREHLERHGVEVESEIRWERGGVSLYFRDPDGHSVEVATPGVWPTY